MLAFWSFSSVLEDEIASASVSSVGISFEVVSVDGLTLDDSAPLAGVLLPKSPDKSGISESSSSDSASDCSSEDSPFSDSDD